jgi:hypothetical protein
MEDESDDGEGDDNDDDWGNDDLLPDFLKFPSEIALRDAQRNSYVQNWLDNTKVVDSSRWQMAFGWLKGNEGGDCILKHEWDGGCHAVDRWPPITRQDA